jgi:hypothetical protein
LDRLPGGLRVATQAPRLIGRVLQRVFLHEPVADHYSGSCGALGATTQRPSQVSTYCCIAFGERRKGVHEVFSRILVIERKLARSAILRQRGAVRIIGARSGSSGLTCMTRDALGLDVRIGCRLSLGTTVSNAEWVRFS